MNDAKFHEKYQRCGQKLIMHVQNPGKFNVENSLQIIQYK